MDVSITSHQRTYKRQMKSNNAAQPKELQAVHVHNGRPTIQPPVLNAIVFCEHLLPGMCQWVVQLDFGRSGSKWLRLVLAIWHKIQSNPGDDCNWQHSASVQGKNCRQKTTNIFESHPQLTQINGHDKKISLQKLLRSEICKSLKKTKKITTMDFHIRPRNKFTVQENPSHSSWWSKIKS